jgi:hypothetical protein
MNPLDILSPLPLYLGEWLQVVKVTTKRKGNTVTFLNIQPVGEPEAAVEDRSSELPAYAELLKKIPVKSQQRFDVPTGKPQYRRVPSKDSSGAVIKATQQDGVVVTVFEKNEDGTDKMTSTGRGMEESRHASLFEQAAKLDDRGVSVRVKHRHLGKGERASDGTFMKDEEKPALTELTVIVRPKREISPDDAILRILRACETRQKKTALAWEAAPEGSELREKLTLKGKHYQTAIKAANAARAKLAKNNLTPEQKEELYESVRKTSLLPEELKGV